MVDKVLVIGASTGLGNALATRLLSTGHEVFAMGRTPPPNLVGAGHFNFAAVDFGAPQDCDRSIQEALRVWKLDRLKLVFLNSGRFSQQITYLEKVPIADLLSLLDVNVFGHKRILDHLFRNRIALDTCVISSSIAGARARAGNSGYALSKAMLNMMGKIYALEHPEVFFLVLGMCNVDTALSHAIATLPLEGDFPDIAQLRARARDIAGYIVSPQQRAADVLRLLEAGVRQRVISGDFVEIRSLIAQSANAAAIRET